MSMIDITTRVNERIDLHVRRATLEMFRSIVMTTPVDTGRAKGNWLPSVDSPRNEVSDRLDKSGDRVMTEIITTVPEKTGYVVWLCNNVDYIRKLEYGGSKQAPDGMVRLAVARFKATFSANLSKSLSQIK